METTTTSTTTTTTATIATRIDTFNSSELLSQYGAITENPLSVGGDYQYGNFFDLIWLAEDLFESNI